MLVTFKTKYYSEITLFGHIATHLLNIMGHSGTVPGAFRPEELPAALQKLMIAVDDKTNMTTDTTIDDDNDDEHDVSLRSRALPVIALLQSAIDANVNVMWE
ncbi:DUF1840 domain-containing protein [Shewanella colwelliana]|uniref:DUF1840 domain-containing protein n=1 Tax=Shewanella colwelliana TaxID=23 RepID=A0A1E5IN62_SHECO|nr:DUF1840 domain-containing protein [Shewanella colwelliana]MDX1282707.1 DUF1840 domain-containing protein [Shewanella colwelliana]OEG71980.1 hypothetical protein BEL05_18625 [Shewanella colwelliana]GIU40090.1 hypothetical protein TUM3794_17180 [Shewanella colwelliana]